MAENNNLPGEIWELVPQKEYDWQFSGSVRNKLIEIFKYHHIEEKNIPEDTKINKAHAATVNLQLRSLLSPHLISIKNRKLRGDLGRWIIMTWGGIKRGDPSTIDSWLDEMDNFTSERIQNFTEKIGFERISSWSKILSFADHKNYAIYDSRTAVALNLALKELGDNRRFFMPASQNKSVKALIPTLESSNKHYLGYDAYLRELKKSPYNNSTRVLSAEMRLFSSLGS